MSSDEAILEARRKREEVEQLIQRNELYIRRLEESVARVAEFNGSSAGQLRHDRGTSTTEDFVITPAYAQAISPFASAAMDRAIEREESLYIQERAAFVAQLRELQREAFAIQNRINAAS